MSERERYLDDVADVVCLPSIWQRIVDMEGDYNYKYVILKSIKIKLE